MSKIIIFAPTLKNYIINITDMIALIHQRRAISSSFSSQRIFPVPYESSVRRWLSFSSIQTTNQQHKRQQRFMGSDGHESVVLNNTCKNSDGIVVFNSLSQSYCSLNEKIAKNGDGDWDRSKGFASYTCGPTVYDSAHLGHARTYVSLDILNRLILEFDHRSLRPIFIMNITDVDDKIIARATEMNEDPLDLARRYEKEFFEDMDALNIMRPTVVTRVSDHVESSIIPYIMKIMENGVAYIMSDDDESTDIQEGSVYFDVGAFERASGLTNNRYGKLAAAATVMSPSEHSGDQSSRVDRKRDPRDFVLWKEKKPTDSLEWNSPWGPGRPGWHIECSAMIEETMKLVSFAT